MARTTCLGMLFVLEGSYNNALIGCK